MNLTEKTNLITKITKIFKDECPLPYASFVNERKYRNITYTDYLKSFEEDYLSAAISSIENFVKHLLNRNIITHYAANRCENTYVLIINLQLNDKDDKIHLIFNKSINSIK